MSHMVQQPHPMPEGRTRRPMRGPASPEPPRRAERDVAIDAAKARRPPRLRRLFPFSIPLARRCSVSGTSLPSPRIPAGSSWSDDSSVWAARWRILFLPEPRVAELIKRSHYFPHRALMRLGEPSSCHANAAMMFVRSAQVADRRGVSPLA